MFVNGLDVSHFLAGVVNVVFHVDDWNLCPFRKLFVGAMATSIHPLGSIAVYPYGDRVSHFVQDSCNIGNSFRFVGFFVFRQCGNIDVLWRKEMRVTSQLCHAGFKTVSSSQRPIEKDHEERFVSKYIGGGLVRFVILFQLLRG